MFAKFFLILAGMFFLLQNAQAAPLTNYDFGHASLDLGIGLANSNAVNNSGSHETGNTFACGADYLTQYEMNFALGYHFNVRYANFTAVAPLDNRSGAFVFSRNAYDIMYGLKADTFPGFFAAYFGFLQWSVNAVNTPNSNEYQPSVAHNWHAGVQANYDFTDKITGYGEFGWGWFSTEARLGASYAFNKNFAINAELDYFVLHGNDDFVIQRDPNIFAIYNVCPVIGLTFKY